jgi:4-diphosphocytidyl-2-C-methyl-D-erythritol kinase
MKAEWITRQARAKINLTLHVTGQRADGYHLLDSLVCFADVYDTLRVRLAEDVRLSVDGPMAGGVPTDGRNLVMQAAVLFAGDAGAEIVLTKALPHAAGIGGGSADAAAALLALAELWDAPLPDDALRLGADVPVCLAPGALRMRGVGEVLTPVPPLPPLWAVLVNPGVAVETPPVFKALSDKNGAPMAQDVPEFAHAGDLIAWCAAQRNDLQEPALQLAPVIGDVLEALQAAGLARMSGSGATGFGLCTTAEEATGLAQRISGARPDWWVQSARLG